MNESIRKQSVPRPARHATLCQSTSASTVGHTFGLPEESPCCACHEGDVAKRLRASNSHVRHALFFATHVMDDPDTALVRDYVLDLAQQKSAAKLSVLYYRPATSPQPMSTGEAGDLRRVARLTGTTLHVWSEDDLFALFPALERSLSKSASLAQTPRAFKRYFFFHASLLLWNSTWGHLYPQLEYFWRLEPDALYAGRLSRMISSSAHVHADLLLPNIESESQTPDWPHWGRNHELIASVPARKRHMSLVSFGRYSGTFLRVLARQWEVGAVGYEEISLPTWCALSDHCSMESFWQRSHIKSAKKCVWRPAWNCSAYLEARRRETQELWHPVKDRSCLQDALRTDGNVEHPSISRWN